MIHKIIRRLLEGTIFLRWPQSGRIINERWHLPILCLLMFTDDLCFSLTFIVRCVRIISCFHSCFPFCADCVMNLEDGKVDSLNLFDK